MRTKKKIGILVLLLVVCAFSLSACGKKGLSSEFDPEEVEELAISVVEMVNNEDTEGIKSLCNDEMKKTMTDNIFDQVSDTLKEFGEYKEISKIDLTEVKDKATKKPIAVAILKVKYTNKQVMYTISFDTDMKLAGLYLK